MSLTDEELFGFDHKRLAHFKRREAQDLLDGEHGDAYRTQLVAALWIDGWRERMEEREESPTGHIGGRTNEWYEGFEYAMREIAAHLRQGDLIPGGVLYDETADGRLMPGGRR